MEVLPAKVIIQAVITRADGTQEYLGTISSHLDEKRDKECLPFLQHSEDQA